jgi:hypothetical protein
MERENEGKRERRTRSRCRYRIPPIERILDVLQRHRRTRTPSCTRSRSSRFESTDKERFTLEEFGDVCETTGPGGRVFDTSVEGLIGGDDEVGVERKVGEESSEIVGEEGVVVIVGRGGLFGFGGGGGSDAIAESGEYEGIDDGFGDVEVEDWVAEGDEVESMLCLGVRSLSFESGGLRPRERGGCSRCGFVTSTSSRLAQPGGNGRSGRCVARVEGGSRLIGGSSRRRFVRFPVRIRIRILFHLVLLRSLSLSLVQLLPLALFFHFLRLLTILFDVHSLPFCFLLRRRNRIWVDEARWTGSNAEGWTVLRRCPMPRSTRPCKVVSSNDLPSRFLSEVDLHPSLRKKNVSEEKEKGGEKGKRTISSRT